MREIRLSGSEGGGAANRFSLPLSLCVQADCGRKNKSEIPRSARNDFHIKKLPKLGHYPFPGVVSSGRLGRANLLQ